MYENYKISTIIPALNEEKVIGVVIKSLPEFVDEIIVVDNGSTDDTGKIARHCGAKVVQEPKKGYGQACLTGIKNLESPEIVVFMDGDGSDNPSELESLIKPIIKEGYDLVIGARTREKSQRGSMTAPQIFGNWLATKLIYLLFNHRYTDLGPFRAIQYTKLHDLMMRDETFGWTVEMQTKAVKNGFNIKEVPVSYKKRIGKSKISGTFKGVILAGYKIITTIFDVRFRSGERGI